MKKMTRKFQTNSSEAANRVMVQCRTLVNRDAVRRESIDGVEHIIVSSSTLPDDIVMNGGLYPSDEIAKSFESLELTLAPVEHPNIDGQFISANDPRAIHGFHAGAFNMNVRREDGRVHVDKYINVAEALKTERGKRLLDRIDELENNSDPRPMHTSVGVFVSAEYTDGPQTNADGDEYTWVARDMVFDHDAILLDSVGAAQPHQGVGVAVNRQGDECKVDEFEINDELPVEIATVVNQSFSEVHKSVGEALERSAIDASWIEELFDDRVVFWSKDQLFEVPYVIDDNDLATIVGIPLPVERSVTFTPKTNQSEGNAMRELMLNALAAAGITVNADISDDELLAKYNEIQANQSDSDSSGAGDDNGIADVVANALKPLVTKIEGLESKINQSDDAELERLAGVVANSGKYPALDADSAKLLGVDKLKEMAANCAPAFGVSPIINQGNSGEGFKAPTAMPE